MLAVMAFVQRDAVVAWVNTNWNEIEDKLVGHITEHDFGRQMHQHLNLLGISSCILLVFLIFNTFAAVVFWRTARARGQAAGYDDARQLVGNAGDDSSDEEIGLHRVEDEDEDDPHERSPAERARRRLGSPWTPPPGDPHTLCVSRYRGCPCPT